MKQIVFFLSLGLLLVSGCVAPDQYQVLENRIAALEMENNRNAAQYNDIATLDSQLKSDVDALAKQSASNQESYADIRYELAQIKERFQMVNGMIEELKFKLGNSSQEQQSSYEKELARLDNAISRNFEKIINLEKYMGFEPTGSKAEPKPGEDQNGDAPAMGEAELYALAKKKFDEGDMDTARIQFENFINKYPQSDRSDNARFWIADSYYVEKWYEKAILEYQKVLEKYPKSNKAAAARLKQGYAFIALGEKANARLILKELVKRHPETKEAGYAMEKLKTLN